MPLSCRLDARSRGRPATETFASCLPAMMRELHTSELDALLELYTHLHAADDPLPDRCEISSTWATIQRDPNLKCFGFFVDQRLVASCTLSITPNLTRGCRPYAVIENVVTHTEYRRRGYGRSIVKQALKDAWACNCYKAMLLTGSKREETYRFYESAGFDRNAKQAFLAKPPEA